MIPLNTLEAKIDAVYPEHTKPRHYIFEVSVILVSLAELEVCMLAEGTEGSEPYSIPSTLSRICKTCTFIHKCITSHDKNHSMPRCTSTGMSLRLGKALLQESISVSA